MLKKVSFWIFLIGTVASALLFLGIAWETHGQVEALSQIPQDYRQCIA